MNSSNEGQARSVLSTLFTHSVKKVDSEGLGPKLYGLRAQEPVLYARNANVTTAMTLMVMIPISLRTTARASRI